MRKTLFVISDLHLGGAPAGDGHPGFQMCSEKGRKKLAEFIDYVAAQRKDGVETNLVINGDMVDFLAEEEFDSFTNDDVAARRKLENVLRTTPEVWKSLAALVRGGTHLTILLGNHDTELSLPEAKKLLLDTLGPGRVDFIYDNQAFVEGPVLIEHGNRYDRWNAISHDALRTLRSALSRREDAPLTYKGPAGSQLVQRVMNPIKAKYPFVDLLKPEGPGMLPIMAVLNPAGVASNLPKFLKHLAQAQRVTFDDNGAPQDTSLIAGEATNGEEELIADAFRLAGVEADVSDNVLGDLWDRWRDKTNAAAKAAVLGNLLDALQKFAHMHKQAFDVNREDDVYINPARVSARRGFKIVVYGHTHLVKRVPFDGGGCYLNSGTWADLIRMPESILTGDRVAALRDLESFLGDLQDGRLSGWRAQIPTFARIDLDDDAVESADVYIFHGAGNVARIPDGPLEALKHNPA